MVVEANITIITYFIETNLKDLKAIAYFLKGDVTCPSYETFMGYGMMPKLNLRNKKVIEYLKEVIQYWKKRI